MPDLYHKEFPWSVKLLAAARGLTTTNKAALAREFGVSRDTLYRWIRELKEAARHVWTGKLRSYNW